MIGQAVEGCCHTNATTDGCGDLGSLGVHGFKCWAAVCTVRAVVEPDMLMVLLLSLGEGQFFCQCLIIGNMEGPHGP